MSQSDRERSLSRATRRWNRVGEPKGRALNEEPQVSPYQRNASPVVRARHDLRHDGGVLRGDRPAVGARPDERLGSNACERIPDHAVGDAVADVVARLDHGLLKRGELALGQDVCP